MTTKPEFEDPRECVTMDRSVRFRFEREAHAHEFAAYVERRIPRAWVRVQRKRTVVVSLMSAAAFRVLPDEFGYVLECGSTASTEEVMKR